MCRGDLDRRVARVDGVEVRVTLEVAAAGVHQHAEGEDGRGAEADRKPETAHGSAPDRDAATTGGVRRMFQDATR